MEITEFKNFLFIMPLDHPFKLTADYQHQTAQILSDKYRFPVLAYRAYEEQIRPWKLINQKTRAKLFTKESNVEILTVSPIHILPFERIQSIYRLNKKLSFMLWVIFAQLYFKKTSVLLWIFHPRFYWVAECIITTSKKLILYDCLDYLSSINKDEEKLLRLGENTLFEISNLTVMNSQFLADFHKNNIENCLVSPSGFVLPEVKSKSPPRDKALKVKIIGFAGSLNYRIDYKLIYKVAQSMKNYLFVFYGPFYSGEEDSLLQTRANRKKLFSLKNVRHVDFLSRENVYKEMQRWDLGIIPYNLNVPLNYYCKPLKLYEYFYFGLPVVSTPIPSIKSYDKLVYFAENYKEWIKAIEAALKSKQTQGKINEKKSEALANTWKKKIEYILRHLSEKTSVHKVL